MEEFICQGILILIILLRSKLHRMRLNLKLMSTLRHLFGSHDAHWAVHCDGWYKSKFKECLLALGYRHLKFEFSHWRGKYNITVRAQKKAPFTSLEQ